MKHSLIVSPTQRTTAAPFLPTLPIEIWFRHWPIFTWSFVENKDDGLFQYQFRDRFPEEPKLFRGSEYLNRLFAIDTPQQLVAFMNAFACPIFVRHRLTSIPYRWENGLKMQMKAKEAPFRWSAFIQGRAKLKDAMRLPIPTLLRRVELAPFFKLETLEVTAERRDGAYYGTITTSPSVEACYRVIAFQRLLANIEYGFCERCGDPYEVKSKHHRKYCDNPACGHAVAQQAYREREKNPQ
jgi:hypothetical protein